MSRGPLYVFICLSLNASVPIAQKGVTTDQHGLQKIKKLFHKRKQVIQVRNNMRVRVNDDSIHCCVSYHFKASCIRVYMEEVQLILNIQSRCLECPQSLSFPLHFLDDQSA